MADSAKRVISGSFGELWMDGELIAEINAFQAKYTYNKEKIGFCGSIINDSKVTSIDGTGSMTLHKVFSRFAEQDDSILKGRDSRCTIIGKLDDPDAYGAERVAIYNVSFDDNTLMDFKHGTVGSITRPFTFTGHKWLDTIDPR